MDVKQLAETLRSYFSKSKERLALLQSTGVASTAMLAAYAYGRANYQPRSYSCPPRPSTSGLLFLPRTGSSPCDEIRAVIVYPEPWLAMLVAGLVGTTVLGVVAATLERSVFARYLLVGWLVFCAAIAVSSYFSYSSIGDGRYFMLYPATPVVALGVATACIFSVVNIVLRLRRNSHSVGM